MIVLCDILPTRPHYTDTHILSGERDPGACVHPHEVILNTADEEQLEFKTVVEILVAVFGSEREYLFDVVFHTKVQQAALTIVHLK